MNRTRQWLQAIGVGVAVGGALVSVQLPDSTTSRDVVSATGCVQRATPAEATAGGQRIDGAFVLRGARTGGTTGRAEGAGLLLVADRAVDLAEHVGKRVIVTGRLSSFAAKGGVASTASGQTLTVTKVTLIAPACTAGS
jgi:hypothetical protein